MKRAIKAGMLVLMLVTLASAQQKSTPKYTLAPEFQKASLRMLEVIVLPTTKAIADNAVIDLGATATTPNEECIARKLRIALLFGTTHTAQDEQAYSTLKSLLQSGSVKCVDDTKVQQ